MADQKVYRAIGMMSGTSLDGVDVALIETDGHALVKSVKQASYPYSEDLRAAVQAGFGRNAVDPKAVDLITQAHCAALDAFDETADIVGFHGQTVYHAPDDGVTVQIGDAQALADHCGVDVIADMRQADVRAGGQGAPLLPLYHRARLLNQADMDLPVVILNIGGVSNVTWIAGGRDEDILAFDCGPGNALLDDFVKARTGAAYDKDGVLARSGMVDEDLLARWMSHPYFDADAPKSLDRDMWDVSAVEDLSDADGAATLTAFTVAAIAEGCALFSQQAARFYVTGGGRHNGYMMDQLRAALGVPVQPVEDLGWNGDALEAEGFAYLAVRSLLGAALTLPQTTGVAHPQAGGIQYSPQSAPQRSQAR